MKLNNYLEGLTLQDNDVIFDYSSSDGIDITLRKNLVVTDNIYSLYPLTREKLVIVRALKNNVIPEKDLNYFVKRSVLFAYQSLPKDIDFILYSRKSFPLLDRFAEQLGAKFSSKVLKLSNSIFKNPGSDIQLKDVPDKYKKEAEELLTKVKTLPSIQLHNDIPGHLRKYFTNFINIDQNILNSVEGKNVLIVDDLLTQGSTINQLSALLKNKKAKTVLGLTLFKYELYK